MAAHLRFGIPAHTGDPRLVVLYVLQVALLLGTAVVLYLALREIDELAAAFTVALLLGCNETVRALFGGMESTPACFLVACSLLLVMRGGRRHFVLSSNRDALLLFLLLLGLSLARLEAGLLAAAWLAIAWWLAGRYDPDARARIALVGAGLAAAAAVYVAINMHLVGVPVPISGLVKASWPSNLAERASTLTRHLDAFAGLIAPPGWSHAAQAVRLVEALLLALGLWVFLTELKRRDPDRFAGLVPFLVFTVGFVAVSSLATGGSYPWYRWPALLLGAIATFSAIRVWRARLPSVRLATALVAVAAGLTAAAGWYATMRTRTLADWGPMRGIVMDSTIRFIREQIPPGDRVGGISSGIFAYFSERDIENLEGLVNGMDFLEARRDPHAFGEYLRRNRIRWVIFHTTDAGQGPRLLDDYERACGIESVTDLGDFYNLNLRQMTPQLQDPHVYAVRLRI